MQQKQRKAIVLSGGLDVVTSQLEIESGRLLECRNYECDLNGGYRQFSGYERFDGRTAPSEGEYVTILYDTLVGAFAIGDTITGGTSGATGELFYQSAGALYLGNVTGSFVEAEVLTGAPSGATANSTTPSYANVVLSENDTRNNIRFEKENFYRGFIQAVPGQGNVLGAYRHLNQTLAVRDLNGSQNELYRSTATGWELVPRVHVVYFEAGTGTLPLPGDTIDDGTNNATVHRVWVNDVTGVTGYITLTDYTVGYANSGILRLNAVQFASITASGGASEFVMTNGGRVEWLSYTFSNNPDHYRLYFVDGVNPCMEYDPVANIVGPIYTDLLDTNDTPKFIAAYKNHLFLGYERGILRNSEPLDPYIWDAAAGSLETLVGAEVTGLESAPSSLIITTLRQIYALQGNAAENFQLDVAAQNVGAKPYTLNTFGTPYMMDDRGIVELRRVEAFGNFESGSVSRKIQPIVLSQVNAIQASVPSRQNNILRFFTADGDGISVTFQEGQVYGFGTYSLGKDLYFISNAEDELGRERTFFGGADGFVYEMDKGVNFDGGAKEAWFKTTYHHLGSPTQRKRFFRAYFSGRIQGEATVSMVAQYSNGSPDVADTPESIDTAIGNAAGWDVGSWDVMYFDAISQLGDVYLDLTGTGDSISIVTYSNTTQDDILTIRDVIYHYKTRRTMRSAR